MISNGQKTNTFAKSSKRYGDKVSGLNLLKLAMGDSLPQDAGYLQGRERSMISSLSGKMAVEGEQRGKKGRGGKLLKESLEGEIEAR